MEKKGKKKKCTSLYIARKGVDNSLLLQAGKCRDRLNDTAAAAAGHGAGLVYIAADETALKTAVAVYGPISAVIDVTRDGFRSYKSGVYRDRGCSSTDVNHAVLVVGYGTDDGGGGDYWIVKNSWGAGWGDSGYALMARNRDNNCGIATMASVPAL